MNDLISRQAAIDVVGIDEEIRCEMCINPMHTDRGCDGCCTYDEKLYKRIMQILDERIKPLPSAQPEIIRCKDCRHRIVNDHYGEKGYLKIKGYCELDTGDPFELGRDAQNDDWFCADAERRTG